ncbi:gamma carbonic anhydrase family protein [Halotalea alkalilenta]|uniref:gamma carbonic anhydrase family protein n=1 Tax=Halotalea alkalilenta TaxID=376489 RepID=UPI000487454C|nr:gamma carbonic anhydrase family protein [Halotalea alkalilenta]
MAGSIYEMGDERPRLATNSFIADGAKLIGAVTMGPESSAWFNAVLRADAEPISIGARSNVQDNCVIHVDPGFPVTLGEEVTIGHLAMIHGCTIGNRCLIGMHATLLNGAVIGDDCIVGAGAVVTGGKHFEPGGLIFGAPARRIRTLSEEELAGIRLNAAAYVERAAKYLSELRRV